MTLVVWSDSRAQILLQTQPWHFDRDLFLACDVGYVAALMVGLVYSAC